MTNEIREYNIAKMVWRFTSAILGAAAVITLVLSLWGSQLFPTKREFKEFKREVKREYVHNKVFQAEIQPIQRQVQALYDKLIGD